MKECVNIFFQQIRAKQMPTLIAYNREMYKKSNFEIGSKNIPFTEVFQWQALNNKKMKINKTIYNKIFEGNNNQ